MARSKSSTIKTLATGGGNATASGVAFQASVAAHFSVHGLTKSPIDGRLSLGVSYPVAMRFETEAPVDDILVSLNSGGWVFIQAKNSLSNSLALTSELGKTCDEFIRLWELTTAGTGRRGWDRPLREGKDALVIAVGPLASGSLRSHLARALDKNRSASGATMSSDETKALDRFRILTCDTISNRGMTAAAINADEILKFVHVLTFDFSGADRSTAEAWLANTVETPSLAGAAFAMLEKECERRMAARDGTTVHGFRSELARGGIAMKAPPDFQKDVQTLRDLSARSMRDLDEYGHIHVKGAEVAIRRASTGAALAAAANSSFVLVGDPGSGKSAVINETARTLHAQGSEVILFAVDRLQVETLDGLWTMLGVSHSLEDILESWPGAGPAFLILDALDACRFGRSETLFRTIMQNVLKIDGGRWRVIASIRTFDLLVGQEFGLLFRGVPPDPDFVDRRFPAVRHIKVGEWSDKEFAELLVDVPELGTAIDLAGPKLKDLARIPFNTRLLADLLSGGSKPEDFRALRSQVQLLDLYWNIRIRPIGAPAEQCLRNTVMAMIGRGQMEASRVSAGAGTGDALDRLQRVGVLISTNSDRDVAFRHHILFDYCASRVLVDFSDPSGLQELLRVAGVGLLLAPALSFALHHQWDVSGPGRPEFWRMICSLSGQPNSDPIARTAAARVACELPLQENDMDGLLAIIKSGKPEPAFVALRHIVGSLSVRLEDEKDIVPLDPWSRLAEDLAPFVDQTAWTLKSLVATLLDRIERDAAT